MRKVQLRRLWSDELSIPGAAIPNARVTAVSAVTGLCRSVNTTSSGEYAIPNVPPGTYDINVQVSGFAAGEARGIKLNAGDQQDLNLRLVLAARFETVVATMEAPLIETTKTSSS